MVKSWELINSLAGNDIDVAEDIVEALIEEGYRISLDTIVTVETAEIIVEVAKNIVKK